ncbi:DUF3558 family protein [Micromonospora sp. C28SCA-DRY-2]|uniref:DUF3558 family protein n=1 Tax=Micromonospora sp. C28SCA-DRY-2 TaxID=3059522 RepID=UPI002676956C|nr:DUF3558 family protein [Micromonospora sp. C28SCA-DRY-2]MDO3704671.1 DUF3558 family protein [Micromonospora sp. C28SCA-DRY-2]
MKQIRRARRSGLLLAGLLGLAGTVAGCGGTEEPPPAAGDPAPPQVVATGSAAAEPSPTPAAAVDPCALVSQQEAEQLAGTRLEDPQPVRETCTYVGPVGGPTAQVEVFVGDGAKKFLDIERDLGHELRPLAGVGDEAYASHEAVFVNRSGVWVSVRLVRLNDPAENRAPLERVARTVAGRL